MLEVQPAGTGEWRVTVRESATTRHLVRVTDGDLERLAQGHFAEELVRESFLFLLEREANTSILAAFDLSVINQYFPEYEEEIQQRLARKTSSS